MKKLVQKYTFVPDERVVYFPDEFTKNHPKVTIEDFLLITNITTGDIIYQFNEPTLGGSFEYNTLTLTYETSGMSATDKLQIFIDVEPSVHITGEDGRKLGKDHLNNIYVVSEESLPILRHILKELKKMNVHLNEMTDLNLTNRDLDGET